LITFFYSFVKLKIVPMKKIFTMFFIIINFQLFSQGRLTFASNPYIVMANGANLVIGNGNANAITNPAAGKIISESETNKIKWNIGNNVGNYIVPFWSDPAGGDVGVGLDIDTAGAGSNTFINFSTYGGKGTSNWISFTNRPSDVSNTLNAINFVENSPNTIDRFWIIDPINYTTNPSTDLNISYIDNEYTAVGNAGILETDLVAQRFNSSVSEWYDIHPLGIVNTITNEILISGLSPANFFRSWTLTSRCQPLPIELLFFKSKCNNGTTVLEWSTATEINNDYFTLEKSKDGMNWDIFKIIQGLTNSTTVSNYVCKDEGESEGVVYYKLSQTDENGLVANLGQITANCTDDTFEANAYVNLESNFIQVSVFTENNGNYNLNLFGSDGREIVSDNIKLQKGYNNFQIPSNNMVAGIYMLNINSEIDNYSQKLFIRR
jgi:hypothetical protein